MKAVYFIGILFFMLATVSSASAETITLTEDNSNVNRDHANTLPDGIINIQVTYNSGTGTITYSDSSPTSSNGGTPYILNPKIDEVAYNLNVDKSSIIGYDNGNKLTGSWVSDKNNQVDGFGGFLRDYTTSGSNSERPDKVVVTLVKTGEAFPQDGNAVAIHLAFEGAYNADGTQIMNPDGSPLKITTLGSTYLAGGVNQIPEFPSMVLPVAAILGLMFISGRKRKE